MRTTEIVRPESQALRDFAGALSPAAAAEPPRIRRIDASGDVAAVGAAIVGAVDAWLAERER